MTGLQRPHATGIAAMAAAAGLSAWLLVQHEDRSVVPAAAGPPAATDTTAADVLPQGPVSEAELTAAAGRLDQPLYWAGPRSGRRYQLGRDVNSGAVAVRYVLPQGDVELTVATIPLADAFAKTEELAGRPTAVSRRLPDGGIAFSPRERTVTAYVAHPGVAYVIEVDTPQAGLARRLAFSARIRPIR
jgi:hypothetical protein